MTKKREGIQDIKSQKGTKIFDSHIVLKLEKQANINNSAKGDIFLKETLRFDICQVTFDSAVSFFVSPQCGNIR